MALKFALNFVSVLLLLKKKHVNCITPAYVKFKQKRRDYAATSPPLLSCVLYKRSSARRLISIPYLYIVHIAQCMEQL